MMMMMIRKRMNDDGMGWDQMRSDLVFDDVLIIDDDVQFI